MVANTPSGFYIVFNNDTALLASSDLHLQWSKITEEKRVLANPLLSRRELLISSEVETSIKQVLDEFFDLSMLHWYLQ
ncbi:MAG: hypothetical protein DRJ59_07090 [Thermoprotei archaeon]|nr:MAG: hypothetical protein DRJ59_07090 [Thermoprotei archaeon]